MPPQDTIRKPPRFPTEVRPNTMPPSEPEKADLPIALNDGSRRFNASRDFTQVAGIFQAGIDQVRCYGGRVKSDFSHPETTAGIHVFDAGHLQQDAPDFDNVMVAVHGREFKR